MDTLKIDMGKLKAAVTEYRDARRAMAVALIQAATLVIAKCKAVIDVCGGWETLQLKGGKLNAAGLAKAIAMSEGVQFPNGKVPAARRVEASHIGEVYRLAVRIGEKPIDEDTAIRLKAIDQKKGRKGKAGKPQSVKEALDRMGDKVSVNGKKTSVPATEYASRAGRLSATIDEYRDCLLTLSRSFIGERGASWDNVRSALADVVDTLGTDETKRNADAIPARATRAAKANGKAVKVPAPEDITPEAIKARELSAMTE